MNRGSKWMVGAVLVAVLVLIGLGMWWRGAGTQPRAQIEHDHGLTLPESARAFQRTGDFGLLEWLDLDRGASAAFIIDRADLEGFMVQFPPNPAYQGQTFIPANGQYQISGLPWSGQIAPEKVVGAESPVGDWVHVEVYPLDGDAVGVRLYTDWN